jgi:hypothetical protein
MQKTFVSIVACVQYVFMQKRLLSIAANLHTNTFLAVVTGNINDDFM